MAKRTVGARLKRLLLGVLSILAIASLLLFLTGNAHILYGLRHTYLIGKSRPDIDDMGGFNLRKIPATQPHPWNTSAAYGTLELTSSEDSMATFWKTEAFLVIHQDSLLFEHYWNNTTPTTTLNSFSMAKSFTAMAVGVAVNKGLIDIEAPVQDYLPQFNQGLDTLLTVKHLLQMRSGIDFGESYSNPFGYQAKAYYGKDLLALTQPFHVSIEPGTLWKYEGGNTVILAEIVQKVTGEPLSTYFGKNIWSPIGAEQTAYWNLDHKDGMEKAFSAVYATARDFARVGLLYQHKGNWKGQQLLSEDFVDASVRPVNRPDAEGNNVTHYGYQWWLGHYNGYPVHSCRGMRGQYILSVPDLNLVVVRLGHNRGEEKKDNMPVGVYEYLDVAVRLTTNK
jgi:CubicO group peptidase (beta-lactamase class C family)